MGVGFGVGAVEFEHAFFRAEDEGAGVFDQFVNPAEAENHDDGADPKLPTNQGKAVAEGARDDESPGDAEIEVDVGVEIEAEILFLVAAEGAEVMQDEGGGEDGEVAGVNMEAVAEEINGPEHGREENDGETVGGGALGDDGDERENRGGDPRYGFE